MDPERLRKAGLVKRVGLGACGRPSIVAVPFVSGEQVLVELRKFADLVVVDVQVVVLVAVVFGPVRHQVPMILQRVQTGELLIAGRTPARCNENEIRSNSLL